MSEEERIYDYEDEDTGKRPYLWVAMLVVLAISLLVNVFLYYKYYKMTHAAGGKSYEELYNQVEVKNKVEKSELNQELDDIRIQLEQAIQKNSGLQGEIEGLQTQLDAKKLEIAKKINAGGAGNPRALREAKAEIEKLRSLQRIFETQSDSLSASNRELIARVLSTESSLTEVSNKARSIEEQKNNLDEKIRSSTLNVADLKVVGIRLKGTTEEETFKSSKINKLKVTFTLLESELIPPGDKEITIRLIGTSQEVLTEDNPSLTDSDKLSTMKETVNYQNEQLKVSLFYSQKAVYKKGTYSIELIHNDKLMGRASFILK